MAYRIELDDVAEQLDALPHTARVALAEACALLELDPWSAPPYLAANPNGAMRSLVFGGHGLMVLLVLEEHQCVDALSVLWAGPA